MKAVILLQYVACLLFPLSYVSVSGQLPSPANVSVESLNTHYVLKWAWEEQENATQNVTFLAQYLAKYKLRRPQRDWITVCESVAERECDFTNQELNYLGVFVLRVRATAHTHTHTLYSPWVDLTFCPDRDAALGPPSCVEVSTEGRGLLEIKISDPVTHSNQSMKDLVPQLYYRIQYWNQDTQSKVEEADNEAALITLSNLTDWSLYCVRVQTRYDFYKKASNFTTPQCIRTQGHTSYWLVVLLFLGSGAVVFVMVLLFAGGFRCFFGKLKSTFFPTIQLPIHIQEYLQEKSSDRPHLLTPESESELVIGQLDLCPEMVVVVALATEVMEAWPEPEDTCHSRHGSGDSGVYSAEESGGGTALRGVEEEKRRRGAREEEEEGERSEEMRGREALKGEEEEDEDEGIRDVCVSVTEG